jgi:hypothetical protein
MPPPLGPEADALPKNEAEPVIGTAGAALVWEKAATVSMAHSDTAKRRYEILIGR